jgi:bla regulator protein BlaR1
MISQIMGNISSISLKAIPFIITLLIVTIIYQKKLNPSLIVGIWFLVFIRLIIPFSLPIQLSSLRLENTLSNIFYTQKNPTYTEDVKAVTEIKSDLPNSSDDGLNPPETVLVQDSEIVSHGDFYSLIIHKTDYGKILWPLLWSIGFLSIVLSVLYKTYSFQKKLKGNREQVFIEGRVLPLFETSAVNYPILFGCFSPKIYVPGKLWSSLSEKEKSFVLLHEEGHYQRKDILSGWLCFLVLAVHWFNPVVWLSYFIHQNLKEIACDHFVLDKLSGKEGIQYARTLLLICESGFTRHTNVFAAGIAGKSSLKRRIEMILNKKKKTILWSLITVIVLSAVITLFLTEPFSPTYINGNPLKDIELKIDTIFNSIIKVDHPGGTALVAIDGKVIYCHSHSFITGTGTAFSR